MMLQLQIDHEDYARLIAFAEKKHLFDDNGALDPAQAALDLMRFMLDFLHY